MALPTSGALSLLDIQNEFGGSNPIGLNEYYGAAAGIPTSGSIGIDDFYGASSLWTPEQISTRVWLDAADTSTIIKSGSNVSRWNDKSGNNNYATGYNSPQSGVATQNGKNVIRFDFSSGRYFLLRGLTSGITGSTGVSVFIMFRTKTHPDQNGGGLWYVQGSVSPYPANHFTWPDGYVYDAFGSTARIQISSPNLASYTLYNAVSRNGLRQMRWNGGGLTYSSGSNTFSIQGSTYLGVSPWAGVTNYYHDGYIAEFIVANGTISTADRQRMEGYLAHKWGRTSALPSNHPYRYAHP